MTKLFNYLRALVFGLAAWTLHAVESLIHPGIEYRREYPRSFVEHKETYRGYLIVVINRHDTERRAIIEDGERFVTRVGPWETDLDEMIDSAKHEIDDLIAEEGEADGR